MSDADFTTTSPGLPPRALVVVSGIALAAGVSLYALLRPEGLLVASWAGTLWPSLRVWTWHGALAGSIPGGLWMLSATAIQAAIWANRPGWSRRLWMLAPLAVGVAWEVGQATRILPGTYDPVDLLAYALGWGSIAAVSVQWSRPQ